MLEKLTNKDATERIYAIERRMNNIQNDVNNLVGNLILLREKVERVEEMVRYVSKAKA